MAKRELGTDSRGNYRRWYGWELGPAGNLRQHVFYFGKVRTEAERRAARLDMLWQAIESRWKAWKTAGQATNPCPMWDDVTLQVGMAIARGDEVAKIDPPQSLTNLVGFQERPELLVSWVANLQAWIPYPIRAGDQQTYQVGEVKAQEQIATAKADIEQSWGNYLNQTSKSGQNLHQALDAFGEWIRSTHRTVEGIVSPTGHLRIRQVRQIKEHQADMPLNRFGLSEIEALVNYWRLRPVTKRGQPAAPDTVKDVIKRIKVFVRWLHKSPAFDWRKPEDLEWERVRIPVAVEEMDGPDQVVTYDLDQLCTLYEYATPFERCLMLLALNCGFGQAEILTLQKRSVKGEYIRRKRYKTGVYGEWKLWPVTSQGIAWMLARHQGEQGAVIVGKDGQAIPYLTDGGNRNNRIAQSWNVCLLARIRKDHPDFPSMSFNKLRKTSSTMIRQIAGGEVAGLFLCHGQVVSDDLLEEYAARHFSAVHQAIDKLAEMLAPMFSKVADPFPTERSNPALSLGQRRRIRQLRDQGYTLKAIAEEVGCHRGTVQAWLKRQPAK